MHKYPDVVEIANYVVEHKRLDGSIAHGPKDPDSTSRKSQCEPRISKQLVVWLKDQLDKGHTSKYIYEVHKKIWMERVKHGQQMTKDDFLDLRNICYYE